MIQDIQYVLDGRSRWCVVTGDAFAIMTGLPERAFDHVITDPPYDNETHAGAVTTSVKESARTRTTGVAFSALANPKELAPVLVSLARRWAIAFCSCEVLGLYREGAGPAYVRGGIWDRINPAPQITGDRPGQAVDALAIMHRAGKKRWNKGGSAGIWRHSPAMGAARPAHPTPKPVPLMVELIRDFTDADDVIFDPFCGSGTTLVAALSTGRRCVGIEIDATYAALATERATAAASGLSLNAARAGQLSLVGAVLWPASARRNLEVTSSTSRTNSQSRRRLGSSQVRSRKSSSTTSTIWCSGHAVAGVPRSSQTPDWGRRNPSQNQS